MVSQIRDTIDHPLARALRRREGEGKQAIFALAEKLDVSPFTAKGYLYGRTPTYDMLMRMVAVYGEDFLLEIVRDDAPAREPRYAFSAVTRRTSWLAAILGRAA